MGRVERIAAHPSDESRKPFTRDYGICRWDSKRQCWAKSELKVTPKRGKKSKAGRHRWDLVISAMGGKKGVYFHRVVGLSVWPCCHDESGLGIEPFWVTKAWAPWYEVDHMDDDCRNCTAGNLMPLWWLHHREKSRA